MNRYVWKFFLISILLINILLPVPGMTQTGPGTSQSSGTITISGVVFDKTVEIDGRTCASIGAGLLRYRVVFKGYGSNDGVGLDILTLAPGWFREQVRI